MTVSKYVRHAQCACANLQAFKSFQGLVMVNNKENCKTMTGKPEENLSQVNSRTKLAERKKSHDSSGDQQEKSERNY